MRMSFTLTGTGWKDRTFWAKLLAIFALNLFFSGGSVEPLFACDEPKVSIGQTKAEVKSKCGEPTWKEGRKEPILLRKTPHKKGRATQTLEEWDYNLGPQQFIRILQFRNGKLASIETGGYGWTPGGPVDFGCDKTILSNGATKMELQGKCGKPTSISKQKKRSGEAWTYNLGPNRFIRIYRFENGRLVETKTGEHGR